MQSDNLSWAPKALKRKLYLGGGAVRYISLGLNSLEHCKILYMKVLLLRQFAMWILGGQKRHRPGFKSLFHRHLSNFNCRRSISYTENFSLDINNQKGNDFC